MVFLCLGLSVFSTIEDNEYEEQIDSALYNLEIVIVIWFGLEFCIRYIDQATSCYFEKHIFLNVTKIYIRKLHIFSKNRLWSSGCRSRYQGFVGRMRFMRSPFCIIGKEDKFDLW